MLPSRRFLQKYREIVAIRKVTPQKTRLEKLDTKNYFLLYTAAAPVVAVSGYFLWRHQFKSAEDPKSEVNKIHHAEGLVNPKVRGQKKVTDFGYPRACRFRKYQIENRSPELTRPTFFKT
jgi:hypothetical protein